MPEPLSCQAFLARYSEYLDGRMHAAHAACWAAHIASCPRCARYDRVVRHGAALFRELPPVEPSSDFYPRLQHRLFHLEQPLASGARASGATVAVSVAVAAALALLAWSPLLRPRLESWLAPSAAPGLASRPGPNPAASAPRQLAAEAWRSAPGWSSFSAWPTEWPRANAGYAAERAPVFADPLVVGGGPGPYSPLLVSAPAVGEPVVARTTSASLTSRE